MICFIFVFICKCAISALRELEKQTKTRCCWHLIKRSNNNGMIGEQLRISSNQRSRKVMAVVTLFTSKPCYLDCPDLISFESNLFFIIIVNLQRGYHDLVITRQLFFFFFLKKTILKSQLLLLLLLLQVFK
jgi:hypothetical protein